MRVQMLQAMAGPTGVALVGQVVEVSAEEAKALIDGNFAVSAEKPEKVTEPSKDSAPGDDEAKNDGKKKAK